MQKLICIKLQNFKKLKLIKIKEILKISNLIFDKIRTLK